MSAEREGLDLIEKVQEQRRRQGWHNGAKVLRRPYASASRIDAVAASIRMHGVKACRETPIFVCD